MKKSNVLRLLALVLAAVMLLACVGCGEKTPAADDNKPAADDKAPAGDDAAPAGDDDAAASDEPVKLKLYCENTWWKYNTWEGRIPELVTAKTGVTCEVTVAADDNTTNMMIASGDMGDLVVSSSHARLNDSNINYDIDSLAEEYGMTEQWENTSDPVVKYMNEAFDGKIYSILVGFSANSVMKKMNACLEGEGLIIRTDILEEVGVKEEDVNGIDDLEALLAKIKEAHPEMVPLTWSQGNECRVPNILWGARREDEGFSQQDGVLYTFLDDPKMKNVYVMLNKWWRNGWISEENFNATYANATNDMLVGGQCAGVIGYGSSAEGFNLDTAPQAGLDWTVTQMINIWNQPGAEFIQRNPGWRGIYIPRSCSDPEAALRFTLWCWTDEGRQTLLWGEEGKDWEWSEDHTYPKLNWDFNAPDESAGMKYWGWTVHNGYENTAPNKSKPGSALASYEKLTSIIRLDQVVGWVRVIPDSNEETIMNNLIELQKNEKAKMVTAASEEECLAEYDNMIKLANDMGMQELKDWATPLWKEHQAGYDKIKDMDVHCPADDV